MATYVYMNSNKEKINLGKKMKTGIKIETGGNEKNIRKKT